MKDLYYGNILNYLNKVINRLIVQNSIGQKN